ncbi:MAG: hypothetical protein DMD33_09390 [Gemmatimonadetes bacterium]|nr:MAG: hypothetical protein DMD33_09390 [Gemmatimonadota bacterium]
MSSRAARSRKRLTASCGPLTWTGSGCDGSTSLIRRTQTGRRASDRLRCARYMACLASHPLASDAVHISPPIYHWRYILSRAGDICPETDIFILDPRQGGLLAIRVRLRELLEKRGMAQTELQAQSGLGYSTINALYHGKTERVEFATLAALCDVLDCGVGEILEHVPDRKRMRS